MKKIIGRWFWNFSTVATLCLSSVVLYRYIVHSALYWGYRDILCASDTFYFIVFTVCSFAAVDAFAFYIGYVILGKFNMLASWKFAVYLVVTVWGNIMIVFLLSPIASENFLCLILAAFILLVFFNFAILEIFFDASIREARFISMLISLINTLIGIMFIPVHC
jgi:hypothetical protein